MGESSEEINYFGVRKVCMRLLNLVFINIVEKYNFDYWVLEKGV